MLNWSPETADAVYFWASIAIVFGAVLTAFASFAIWVAGCIRDAHSRNELLAAQSETIKLREQIAPRQVSAQQKEALRKNLRGIQSAVGLQWPTGNIEAEKFTLQLAGALAEAGFTVSSNTAAFLGAQPPEGATVYAKDKEFRAKLSSALRSIGHDVQEGADLEPVDPYILVGPKRQVVEGAPIP